MEPVEENDGTPAERRAFADWLRALDPYDHPIALHNRVGDLDDAFGTLLGTHLELVSLQGDGPSAGATVRALVQDSAAPVFSPPPAAATRAAPIPQAAAPAAQKAPAFGPPSRAPEKPVTRFAPATTVKVTAPEVPADVVTVTLRAPDAASELMVNVAVTVQVSWIITESKVVVVGLPCAVIKPVNVAVLKGNCGLHITTVNRGNSSGLSQIPAISLPSRAEIINWIKGES